MQACNLHHLYVIFSSGSHGVHLEMSAHNSRACRFYKKLGFKELKFSKEPLPADDVLVFGRAL